MEKNATSIPRQLKQIEKSEIDVGIIFAKNKEREKILDYPMNYFIESRPTLAVLKDHPLRKVDRVEDILKLKIGYGEKAYISPFMRDERIHFKLISSPAWFKQNFRKLLIGRNDAIYMPEAPPLLFMSKELGAQDKIRLIGLPESSCIYTAFSKKLKTDLPRRYDDAFKKVGGRDMYIKILGKYIDINKL